MHVDTDVWLDLHEFMRLVQMDHRVRAPSAIDCLLRLPQVLLHFTEPFGVRTDVQLRSIRESLTTATEQHYGAQ